MISLYKNFIDNEMSRNLIEIYQERLEKTFIVNDNVYNFSGLSVSQDEIRFTKDWNCNTLRIQKIDPTTKITKHYHIHKDKYSVVIFLNDDFNGGELIFPNITIKPIKNMLVYFTGDEPHYVNETDSDRYTLVSFLKSPINIFKHKLI